MAQAVVDLAQLKKLTFRRKTYCDQTLGGQNLKDVCPLDNGKFCPVPQFDLGDLEKLPPELLSAILVQVDLRTLTDFRRINQRAMQIVNSIPQYKTILKHGLKSLRGALVIESSTTCQDLFRTLGSPHCENCGDFGGHTYLLACTRVCFMCFANKPQYLPLLASEASRRFAIPRRLVNSLTQIRSLPGNYALGLGGKRSSRRVLFDWKSAYRAGVTFHGSEAALEQVTAERARRRKKATVYLRDDKNMNPRRFMAIVRAPWIYASHEQDTWGFHCRGCLPSDSCPESQRVYTLDTFEQHLREYGPLVRHPDHRSEHMHHRGNGW